MALTENDERVKESEPQVPETEEERQQPREIPETETEEETDTADGM